MNLQNTSFLSLILFMIKRGQATHSFISPEEEENCRQSTFVQLTPNRVVYSNPMSWYSADLCCKMKGQILHTIERADESREFPLLNILSEIFDSLETKGLWIGLTFRHHDFHWQYGTELQKSWRSNFMREKYKWAEGHPKENARCVGILPKEGTLEMYSLSCNTKMKFICQKMDELIEEPLTGHDMMKVGSAEFQEIEGFSNLRWSKISGGWSLAKALCQSQHWSLIDHVHDIYGPKLFRKLMKMDSASKGQKVKNYSIHSSANDFCEKDRWQWNCGEKIWDNVMPWSKVQKLVVVVGKQNHPPPPPKRSYKRSYKRSPTVPPTTATPPPIKKLIKNKRCVHFSFEKDHEYESSDSSEDIGGTVTAKNVFCHEEAFIVCDSTPPCDTSKLYPCLHRDPHYINYEELLEEDMNSCANARFKEMRWPNSNGKSFQLSLTKLTWAGAKHCCESRGWKVPSPRTEEEMEALVDNTLGAAISTMCRSELECDAIWTSTSNRNFPPYSPLRYPDGGLVPKKLYSSLRADAFTYPSCGRINYLNFEGASINAKYFHAHCLEKNLLVCESIKTSKVRASSSSRARSLTLSLADAEVKPKLDLDTVRFNTILQNRFNESLTMAEIQAREWSLFRGQCLGISEDVSKSYKGACPNSLTSIFSNVSEVPVGVGKKPPPLPPTEAYLTSEFQNRFLLDDIVQSLFKKRDHSLFEEVSAKSQGLNFLSYSAMIYSQMCPIVPIKFITKISYLFTRLITRADSNIQVKPNMMSKANFLWTIRLLTECQELVKPKMFKHDQCGDLIIAKDTCTDYICTDPKYEMNFHKIDLIMDFMWKMFEVTHASCFPAFQENPLLHHKFAMSVVDLWTGYTLRLRWSYHLSDKKFWIRLLGPHFETHFINMERCNDVIIKDSMFHVRLPRDNIPLSARIRGLPYKNLKS